MNPYINKAKLESKPEDGALAEGLGGASSLIQEEQLEVWTASGLIPEDGAPAEGLGGATKTKGGVTGGWSGRGYQRDKSVVVVEAWSVEDWRAAPVYPERRRRAVLGEEKERAAVAA
ncbi:hypothetical protein ACOSP7_006276 [Xanthoceras sorbifolium]